MSLVINSNDNGNSGELIANRFIESGFPSFDNLLIKPSIKNQQGGGSTFYNSQEFTVVSGNTPETLPVKMSVNGTAINILSSDICYPQSFLGNNAGGVWGGSGIISYSGTGTGTGRVRVGINGKFYGGEIIGKHIYGDILGTNLYASSTSDSYRKTGHIDLQFRLLHSDGTFTDIATITGTSFRGAYNSWTSLHYSYSGNGVEAQEGDILVMDVIFNCTASSDNRGSITAIFGNDGGISATGVNCEPLPIEVSIE